ncbi:MAG: hypothetical protein UY72_C0006G0009 [Candidatus Uhrbacteria bacterium GW2011_GWD2_52_7]|uniref:Uncharacterized protein n=1 Tax=Candidatus Uhrbacteria bacterium GW2011_GWD2_52_7 TaxID=1618989 RepID=A0A0G1XHF4_9BACT|nr:MAG: hypothetical protein UY72_C0006G0009 [Candidatus Uhrbacteria bacterium GW2011_GWD2_52_7]
MPFQSEQPHTRVNPMQTYQVKEGVSLNQIAPKVIALAKQTNEPVTFTFNGIELIAQPKETTVQDLKNMYAAQLEVNSALYNSEMQKELQNMQRLMDEGMVKLKTLDFTDLYAVVMWIYSIHEAADYIGVVRPWREILAVFMMHGYEPKHSTERTKKELADEHVFAVHIIEQTLDFLVKEPHALHQIVSFKIEEYQRRFPRN